MRIHIRITEHIFSRESRQIFSKRSDKEQNMSDAIYGINSLGDCLVVAQVLTPKRPYSARNAGRALHCMTECRKEEFTTHDILNALNGLSGLDCKNLETRLLMEVISQKIRCCTGRFDATSWTPALATFSTFYSDFSCTRRLLTSLDYMMKVTYKASSVVAAGFG